MLACHVALPEIYGPLIKLDATALYGAPDRRRQV